MNNLKEYSFTSPEWGSLDLKLENISKQVYSQFQSESLLYSLEGLGGYSTEPIPNIYFFEWQKIQYIYEIEDDNKKFSPPFQLRINNRCVNTSKDPKNHVHILHGQFSFDDEVGQTRIEIRDYNNRLIFGLNTEVFPQKMDYKSDYKAMMAEISSIIQNLAYDSLKDTFRQSRAKIAGLTTQNEWWNILQVLFNQLILNINVIKRQAIHEIRTKDKVLPVERIKNLSKNNMTWFRKNVNYSNQINVGIQIENNNYYTHALSSSKYVTYDTYENRFVAWAIENIIEQLRKYKKHTEQNQGNKDYSYLITCMKNYQGQLQNILHENPFNETGSFEKRFHFSTVLTRGAGYRDFMHIYLLLQRGLELAQIDIFKIEQKDISTLYEYWCFLMLVKIIKEQNPNEIDYQDLIKIKAGKIKVELEKGKNSKVTFKNKMTDETTTVYFNREFIRDGKKVFTYNQRPDYSIEFSKKGFSKPFWYIFDAKYRFDEYINNELGEFNAPQDTIGQLHRYRDAILHSEPSNSTYRGAIKNLGGIILFPYPLSEEKYRENNIYFKSINEVNIGALPFLPSKISLVSVLLKTLLNKAPEEHFEHFIDMDRSEYDVQRNLWREWVTIGVIPKDKQSERITFIRSKFIYYLPFVKDTNSRIYMTDKMLLCISGTNNALSYDVTSWEMLSVNELQSLDANWNHKHEKYIAFHLKNEIAVKIPKNITPLYFRYATSEGLKRYLNNPSKNKWCFYLTNPDAARLHEDLTKNNINFEVSWQNDKNDPSLVEFKVDQLKILSSDTFAPLLFNIEKKQVHLFEIIKKLKF